MNGPTSVFPSRIAICALSAVTVTFDVVVLVLPEASVAVHMTAVVPVANDTGL